ncbi:hypothetical protein [Cupriavidus malaysiensis]|uniref:Uncharacterized protein n=1 Tax=Cupriavidus malaysiensis TaxID=367825 RepID=A0ABM6EZT5_9BURK|nr:hypothetical protein [Cupriavidus malaysiensis]AOZ04640.1 hypothetical protein BKK80_01365 [Cupriavidus malaysiensis]
MKESFHDAELRQILRKEIESHRITELGDSSPFFAQLAKAYPALGSRVDWALVPNSIERVEEDESLQAEQFVKFFDEVVRTFGLCGDAVYLGDSATDFALSGSLECLREMFPELLAIPQHHYLVGPDSSWCLCFTMEGDMGFGFRPPSTLAQ